MGQRGNLRALAAIWISLQLFLEVVINGSLISETSAHFNQVLKAKNNLRSGPI